MSRAVSVRLLVGLGLLILIGAALWWYLNGEYEERQVYRPDNSKLRTERFHVTGRWLNLQGLQTESLNHLQDLDSRNHTDATLIIPTPLDRHNDLEARQLFNWVENGGHLIAPAPQRLPQQPSEYSLNRYGIEGCPWCLDGDNYSLDEPADRDAIEPFRQVRVPGAPPRRLWGTSGLIIPEDLDGVTVWPDEIRGQPVVARYFFGSGRVTLLPTTSWLDNSHLIYPDHARFLLDLIDTDRSLVFLQQRSQPGGFLNWLWQRAPQLWPLVILLALLWVWSRLPRLGPVGTDGSNDQRQMRDHILATARFDWRHNRGSNLIAAMREERARRLLRRFPDWTQIKPSTRLDRLEHLCPQADRERLAWYLSLDHCNSTDALDDYVRLHQQLMHVL